MPSLKKNIVLNAVNTLSGLLFPVVTFPYAARILLPEGIGAVNFLNSIVSYIILLTSIGIPMYAVKEVAKYRDSKYERDKVTIEILILSTLLCLLGYVAVFALAQLVPRIHEQSALFYILSLSILFSTIGVNWFYQGIEDFKFITIRAIVVRCLSAAALFIFVHDSSDLLIYGVIVVGSTVGNNFINFIHLRKHLGIRETSFLSLNIRRHLKPALQVFVLNLIISLYIQLNSIMLGFMTNDEQVGFFTAGTKITHIGVTIITSIGSVLLPRCSHLIQVRDTDGFASVIKKSLNLTLLLSLPLTAGLMIMAAPVTLIFCGPEFSEAIPVLYLNAPVIIFISLTNVMGIQILYPMDKINLVVLSVGAGAVCNLILNLLLIPSDGAVGAAIATFVAELSVLIVQMAAGRKFYPFKLKELFTPQYIISTLIMALAVWTSGIIPVSVNLKLAIGLAVGIISYFASLAVFKDSFILEILALAKTRFHHPH